MQRLFVRYVIVCSCFKPDYVRFRTDEEGVAQEEEQPDEKMMERTKRRACQQVYTSSPVKAGEKLAVDDTAGN